jgi:gliding motility-associated protein GldC
MKKSDIVFTVGLDENHIPEEITWNAEDTGDKGAADAVMLAIWDSMQKEALRIDLWTKYMDTHDMKLFVFQSMMTMADSFERATGEELMAKEMREFGMRFGEKMELIKPNE